MNRNQTIKHKRDSHGRIPVICTRWVQFSWIFMSHYAVFVFTVNPLKFSHWFGLSEYVLKWYYDQKIISFFPSDFEKRIRLTSNWQNFELCVLSEGCLF